MEAADTEEAISNGKRKNLEPGRAEQAEVHPAHDVVTNESETEEDEDEEDDEDEEEPRFKYASLTKSINSVYRNGDATSSVLAAGDKMIAGTHNGNIHVLSVPSFDVLRVYHAHSASVTSISISPFPPPLQLPLAQSDMISKLGPDNRSHTGLSLSESAKSPAHSKGSRPQTIIPATSSNSIYIATSSIDGNVCVSSLVDPKDVLLRNFGRPIQAVALSPEYKHDRSYLSGGLAGSLVLTTGGRIGTSSNSTLMGTTTANPSSWFGSFGLAANNGKDTVLHSGEGAISAIKWSLSGKYVVWVNEEGIKIMRSNLHLESVDSEFAWKRLSHIDRPNLPGWEEMASVWKPRLAWVDEESLDENDDNGVEPKNSRKEQQVEKLVVGWGGTLWIINVFPGGQGSGKDVGERTIGSVEVATILRMDCIISGVSLYTPSLLLVLAYVLPDDDDDDDDDGVSRPKQAGPQRGIRHKQNGLEPELRLINIETEEELSSDTLSISRYESLSAQDYHLSALPPIRAPLPPTQRGALEAIGTGLLDATLYPTRLFSSAASARSATSSGDKGSSTRIGSSLFRSSTQDREGKEMAISSSNDVKIFIHSPYDCVIAVKRGLGDRLTWLDAHERYEEALQLLDEHPEAATPVLERTDSVPSTPTMFQGSLADFFADEAASAQVTGQVTNSLAEREKQRIGEKWLEQLVQNHEWERAGEICAKVLKTTPRWDHWIWIFARNNKFDELSPYIPTDLSPPLPSLVFEVVLGHYVSRDRARFKELLDSWSTELFDISSVTAAIEDQLKSKTVAQGTDDWLILTDSLAKLFLAGGHYREALKCYIRIQDAEAAMSLIREYHLLDAIADDIASFILIRVSKEQLKSAPIPELDEATSEPIKLLVREASNGIVGPAAVVSQLQAANRRLYLFFYLRTLWKGESATSESERPPSRRHRYQTDAAHKLIADEGRALIDSFADTVVESFADYDRDLLMEFLQSSTSYSYSTASSICETRHYTPELIYLLSKTGQTKRALNLILSDLKDVSRAISFAKSQDDPDLWDDLLSYSMDKPEYIRGLLAEVGTSIDPIKLVRRIPSGLEIEGLREGLARMIREHDIQASISQGVAKVLIGEVAIRMDTLRRGQRRGIKFDIVNPTASTTEEQQQDSQPNGNKNDMVNGVVEEKNQIGPGRCGGCGDLFAEQETETLVGFACGHVFHLSHLHPEPEPEQANANDQQEQEQQPTSPSPTQKQQQQYNIEEPVSPFLSRTVGPKVTTARLLKDKIGDGCRICLARRKAEQSYT
ncbi:hypothetical protein AJ80_04326 [Polytolypa hystricis UAMH7299]|uniref:Vps41 beta-propeller domain-containing protein n=1 Tax=Polytolypa hystricis (strain UAMH7299) TaxID=1447883 RepID=A0A2B7YE70_POLH7|nr:hypothetical protein AJ80_04326 [Polytolypa hystricis UAMH7299]